MLSGLGRVSAFELDAGACEVARSRGFAVVEGRLPDEHPFVGQRFDLIFLLDVLEHVEADQESLNALARLLKPGGKLILTVPAFPFLWSSHDVQHHHFRRYRRPGLRAKLEQAGLEVQRISYFNTVLFPLIALVRVLKNLTGARSSDEEQVPRPFLNSVLEFLFSSERFLLPRLSFPFGVSLFSVCKLRGMENQR
jgi:SAM-dependent methyltransferase